MASIYEKKMQEVNDLLREGELTPSEIAKEVGASDAEVNERVSERLLERAVLIRAVCHEVREADGDRPQFYRRAKIALNFVENWREENVGYRYSSISAKEIRDALPNCDDLIKEIQAGESVCYEVSLQGTADSLTESKSDDKSLRESLDVYWKKHGRPQQ